jgi:hypothetical protein
MRLYLSSYPLQPYSMMLQMKSILEAFSNVPTPLALGGLTVGVLFLIFSQILRLKLFPKLDKRLGAQTIRHIINWLGVLATIGILFGFLAFILPIVLPIEKPEDSYRGNIPANLSLRDAARWVAETEDGFDVEFGSACTEKQLGAKVSGGFLAAGNIARAIERLPRTVADSKSRVAFKVTRSQERGLYEVDCR